MNADGTDPSGGWPDAPDTSADRYVLRLYVSGTTPRSTRAIENIKQICDGHLSGRYELEVVDIYAAPEAAGRAQVVAVPTLVKLLPEPLRRVIGDLADHDKVLSALSIVPNESAKGKNGEP